MRPTVAVSPSIGAATPADSCSAYSHADSADAIACLCVRCECGGTAAVMAHGG